MKVYVFISTPKTATGLPNVQWKWSQFKESSIHSSLELYNNSKFSTGTNAFFYILNRNRLMYLPRPWVFALLANTFMLLIFLV